MRTTFATHLIFFTLIAGLATLTACSDDDDSGNNSSNSGNSNGNGNGSVTQPDLSASVEGVESSSEAGSLSDDQTRALCEELQTYISTNLPDEQLLALNCTLGGVFAAGFAMGAGDPVMLCEQARTECIAEGFDEEDSALGCEDATLSDQCTATVSEIEACFFEQIGTLSALANTLTCETGLSQDSTMFEGLFDEQSAGCMVLQEKCPELLDDDDSSSGGTSNGSFTDSCSESPGPDCCVFANDGECDEPTFCDAGTDTTDCGG